ncbi:MAG: AraC family transcriptional regulator [Clostridia bacterium]|nr:AraC family transcriptional regulator [Clostridia bacterium]
MSYNEILQRGTHDFPIELYKINKNDFRYEMTSHWHGELEIVRVLKGTLNIRLNNNEYLACPGDTVFANSETVHYGYPEGDCEYECIVFDGRLLNAHGDALRKFTDGILKRELYIREFIPSADKEVYQAVSRLFDAMAIAGCPEYQFMVMGALYNLFGVIISRKLYFSASTYPMAQEKNIPKIRKALEFMRENFDKQITLENIAGSVGMSPKYFCLFFRDMTRKTPFEYLTAYRIENASCQLINTDKTVTEIAFSCGFNDLSYFIKTFKSLKNITPAQYRKM